MTVIVHRFPAESRLEGAGTHITRWFTPVDYALTNPFLLFDETKSDKIEEFAGGFPEHPHRGFEALTYVISGTLRHKDSAGFTGYIGPEGAQWLCNAAGLTHDEVPAHTEGLFWCLQLWINLPSELKKARPFYEEIGGDKVPVVNTQKGIIVRVVAGQYENVQALLPSMSRPASPVYLDVCFEEKSQFDFSPEKDQTVLIFVVNGEINPGEEKAVAGETLVLAADPNIEISGNKNDRFILMAGQAINEEIAWHGPFVMNTEAELQQAREDFRQFGPFQTDTGTGMENEG